MDLVELIRSWTCNLDRAVTDLQTGDSIPLLRAILSCETNCQSALLAVAVCSRLDRRGVDALLQSLLVRANGDLEHAEFG
jgi:hypothetical protein